MSSKPLNTTRIIDLSRVLAGPWATQILADMGGDVIKVERPGHGDDSRSFGPPFMTDENGDALPISAMFMAANRNKRSISVNLASKEGQDIVRRLAAEADVFVENYKVGDLARRGLDYKSLSEINPRLVYCSITGYGQTGPLRERGGYDPVAQAMCGFMSTTGYPLDQPGGGPMKAGPSVLDMIAGLYAVIGIQGALLERERTGQGQHIDISLLDCGVAIMAQHISHYFLSGVAPGLIGTQANGGAPGGAYRCSDGFIMIAPGNQDGYVRMCHALGRADLIDDERFVTNQLRIVNRPALTAIMDAETARWTVNALAARLTEANIPCSAINSVDQAIREPQVVERGMISDIDAHNSRAKTVSNPIRFSRSKLDAYRGYPLPGEQTDEILDELGISAQDIQQFRESKII